MIVETKRIKELKQLKKLANTFLDYYVSEQKVHTKGWKNDFIKRNISLLKDTINAININLHPEKLKEYLQAVSFNNIKKKETPKESREKTLQSYSKHFETIMSQGSIFILIRIVKCSPHISYFNDFTWFNHGTINELIKYSFGKTSEKIFEKYLPAQVSRFKDLENDFFTRKHFVEDAILVKSILVLIENKKFIPSNILTITLIEGLIRKFCYIIYKKQNIDKSDKEIDDYIYNNNLSFERLITETSWLKDIPIKLSEFVTKYSYLEDSSIYEAEKKIKKNKKANEKINKKLSQFQALLSGQLEIQNLSDEEKKEGGLKLLDELKDESKNLLTEDDKLVMIGIDVYLDFLVKKFKDDRNNIIHGKYSLFKEKWRTLFYLTALEILINKIIWYEENISFE